VVGALNESKGTLSFSARILNLKQMKVGEEIVELGRHWRTCHAANPHRLASAQAGGSAQHHDRGRLPAQSPQVRLDAMESYVRGLGAASTEQRIALFTKAANMAPDFMRLAFNWGCCTGKERNHRAAMEWLNKVKPPTPDFHHATFCSDSAVSTLRLSRRAGGVSDSRRCRAAYEVFNDLGAAQLRRELPEADRQLPQSVGRRQPDPVSISTWVTPSGARGTSTRRCEFSRRPGTQPLRHRGLYMLDVCMQKTAPRPGDSRTGIWSASKRVTKNALTGS
jgi:hypothetical protein